LTVAAPSDSLAVALEALTADDIEQLARSAVPDLSSPAPAESPDVMSAAARKGAAARDYAYQQERLEFARDCELQESTEFGAVYRDKQSGETISYAYWAQAAATLYDQMELDLSGPNFRAAVRKRMAERFRGLHARTGVDRYRKLAERLDGARKRGARYFNHKHQKFRTEWEFKAGLNLYCPDDARDNAKRLDKRYRPALLAAHKAGFRLQYCVLTTPSCAPGQLKRMQRMQFRRLRRRILKKRYPDGSLVFPEIKGALVVQESPLGWNRDWHAHLNVLFVVEDYLHFGKLRSHWGDHLHIDPPLGQGLKTDADIEKCIGSALREIIKYAVTAVSAKSEVKAYGKSEDRPAPPGMTEWTDAELLEYDASNVGHHRTRTYGCLRGVPKPPKEDRGQETFLGWREWHAAGYRDDLPLLKSILGKISTGDQRGDLQKILLRSLAPGGLVGAGRLGEQIPPNVLAEIEF
jgi:hypothetical protein